MSTTRSASTGSRASTYLLLATGMALFGSATPVSKLVGETFPSMVASGLRMLTAFAVLAPVLAIRRMSPQHSAPRLQRRDWLLLAGIAAIGTFGFTLLLFYGMRQAPGAVGAVVMATTPAVTAIMAWILFDEAFSLAMLAGMALTALAVAMMMRAPRSRLAP